MSQPPSGFAEAVVVLANLMDRDGGLNEDSCARLELATALVRDRPHSCLITSGWNYRPDSPIMISHAMRDRARDAHGIVAHRIFSDSSARDTVGDAVFVKRSLVEPSGIRDVTVVSSAYHMHRVQQIFAFVFGSSYKLDFVPTQVDHARNAEEAEVASLAAFRATFDGVAPGDTEAIYQRLVSSHPLYNGTVHPAL